ncbi:DUF4062 domain-containing protein [Natronospirillum operosum]|uniref:DUF4062 domain-containing protein n=2 Tax=Natronospirillum operosum TaxID=2759953 RepID=A0A4Z0WJF7_9GAMM|nr:DUF4062 domain-containing protein [Natronospirillum operosum]
MTKPSAYMTKPLVDNRRYLACVSSNQSVGDAVRRDVAETLAALQVIATGFSFPAVTDGYQWKLQQLALNDADFCVVILGRDYGPVSESGVGHLHRAAAHAMATGKPVLALVCDALSEPADDTDLLRRESLLADLHRQAQVLVVDTPGAIRDVLEQAVDDLLASERLRGWCPVGRGSAETDVKALQQEIQQLQTSLDQARRGEPGAGHSRRAPRLSYRVKVFRHGNLTTVDHELRTGWNELFAWAAPLLTEPRREADWKSALEERLLAQVQPELEQAHPEAHGFVSLRLDGVHFDDIKRYFRSLGWLSQTEGVWRLTTLGEHEWLRSEEPSARS